MKSEDILFDLIKEVREEQKEIKEEIHQQSIVFKEHLVTDAQMHEELSLMNQTLILNTQSLKEHMQQTMLVREQTEILKQIYEIQSKRIDELTKPIAVKDVLAFIAKICAWVSAVGGAVYAIIRLLS